MKPNFATAINFGLPFRSGQALTTGYATLVLVTSIAKQSRTNGNVSCGHSPTTNVGNPNALYEIASIIA
jgi:hypothetical protein